MLDPDAHGVNGLMAFQYLVPTHDVLVPVADGWKFGSIGESELVLVAPDGTEVRVVLGSGPWAKEVVPCQ